MYPVELRSNAVLQYRRLGLSLYLFVNLAVYQLVPFGKSHPFQRVGGRYLRLRKLRFRLMPVRSSRGVFRSVEKMRTVFSPQSCCIRL